ncbi:MAG: ATPase, T2SS/T4P/T4SS family [Rhodospirillaceae bacterium]
MSHTADTAPDIRLDIRTSDGDVKIFLLSGHGEKYLIGRSVVSSVRGVDVMIDDMHASRRHCELFRHGGGITWMVRDLLSSNGTRIDGEVVRDLPVQIRDGARISVGRTLLAVTFGSFADAVMPIGDAKGSVPDRTQTLSLTDTTKITTNVQRDIDLLSDATISGNALSYNEPTLISAPEVKNSFNSTGRNKNVNASVGHEATIAIDEDSTVAQQLEQGHVSSALPTAFGTASNVRLSALPVPDSRFVHTQARLDESEAERAGLRGFAAELVGAQLVEAQKALVLKRLAREKGRTFFRELAFDGSIKFKDEIYKLAAKKLGIELIESENILMDRAKESKEIPYALAANLGAVLLQHANDTIVLYATIDPFDVAINDWIANTFRKSTHKVMVLPNHFHAALQRLKTRMEEDESGGNVLLINMDVETERQVQTRVESVEVPQIVNYFLQKSHSEKASDIHIEPTEEYLLVRYRVDGILHEMTSLPVNMHPEIISRIKILSGMDVAEKRRPQDGRIATVIRDHPIDIRVSSYPTIYGEKFVMRLLDKNALQETPSTLGLVDRDLRRLYEKLEAPFGLVMISGPTGSGKTTTLYSCLSYIDKKTKNVLTVEDPVEYRLKGVHQMQVNEKIGLTFASGLRTILRQDPDIIMVGECRDAETAGMAIQAALTGHIVFSTIHTNDAIGVITRMIDMGVDAFLVANALTLCIAQRLVRKICRHCQAPVEGAAILEKLADDGITSERLAELGIEIDAELNYVVGSGCVHCRNTGYQGRRAVFEVFEVTQEARSMIVSPNFSADELRRRARLNGMTSLIGHGLMLVDEGITTHAEVLRVLGESY